MNTKKAHSNKRSSSKRRAHGFVQTGGILGVKIRKTTEKRGFTESRLLTHWSEIAGEETARLCRPVNISYGREGFGATLTLLTNGANAPMLQAETPKIQARVNACYGYAAISRIRLTQTAETGFAEDQTPFTPQPTQKIKQPDAKQVEKLDRSLEGIHSKSLRLALDALGRNVLTRTQGS